MTHVVVWLVTVVVVSGAVGFLAFYLVTEHIRKRNELCKEFRTALLNKLQGNEVFSFRFQDFVKECEIPIAWAQHVARGIYEQVCDKVYLDGLETVAERQRLDKLATLLDLRGSASLAMETASKQRRYAEAAATVARKASVTDGDAALLAQLRKNLGLSPKQAIAVTEKSTREDYRNLIQRVVADGQVTADEMKELSRFRTALGLPDDDAKLFIADLAPEVYLRAFRNVVLDGLIQPDEAEQLRRFRAILSLSEQEANGIIRKDAFEVFRQAFYQVVQKGVVTGGDEQMLSRLADQLGFSSLDLAPYYSELAEVKRLAAIRGGNLPSLRSSKLLEGGEICHWEGSCEYSWKTTRAWRSSPGILIVTSQRLIFSSASRSLEFAPAKIVDVCVRSNAIEVRTSSGRGNGNYYVSSPRELEAILFGLVRKHKYLQTENFESNLTRHIPDLIKRQVWDRDGGRCVKCGASQYLEFDHIIPHARGGANTVNNVQVLCRGCNSEKSDRI